MVCRKVRPQIRNRPKLHTYISPPHGDGATYDRRSERMPAAHQSFAERTIGERQDYDRWCVHTELWATPLRINWRRTWHGGGSRGKLCRDTLRTHSVRLLPYCSPPDPALPEAFQPRTGPRRPRVPCHLSGVWSSTLLPPPRIFGRNWLGFRRGVGGCNG